MLRSEAGVCLIVESELFDIGPDRVDSLVLALNRIYSRTATCDWCGPTPDSWIVDHNTIRAYVAPPARP